MHDFPRAGMPEYPPISILRESHARRIPAHLDMKRKIGFPSQAFAKNPRAACERAENDDDALERKP
jgi:hypothetical protein